MEGQQGRQPFLTFGFGAIICTYQNLDGRRTISTGGPAGTKPSVEIFRRPSRFWYGCRLFLDWTVHVGIVFGVRRDFLLVS